jgi:hypothetical protein
MQDRVEPDPFARPTAMDLKQLDCFVHVAESGSFMRSSRYLQVAQPALSRQVARWKSNCARRCSCATAAVSR